MAARPKDTNANFWRQSRRRPTAPSASKQAHVWRWLGKHARERAARGDRTTTLNTSTLVVLLGDVPEANDEMPRPSAA